MDSRQVGEVLCTGTGCFQWTIDDFLSEALVYSMSIKSPDFRFLDVMYYMNLRMEETYDKNVMSLYVCKRSDSASDSPHVKVGMKTGIRGKMETRRGEMDRYGNFYSGYWMELSEILTRRCEILSNGRLTVFCMLRRLGTEGTPLSEEELPEENKVLETNSEEETMIPEYKTVKKLQKDFMNMFLSGDDCDVTIKVQSKVFPAHKNILRARSPVFRSMFSHEMAETLSGEVIIDDCEPGTFPDFLNYLYTGSTKHISGENVCHLYTASDKYQVEELKEECIAFMKNNFSVATFCDVLTLALQHVDKELIGLSTEFFCSNAREITKTAKWQTFLRENTTAGNELIIKLLSQEKDF